MIRSVRNIARTMASAWSKVPEPHRKVLRPVVWKLPGLQRLRDLERRRLIEGETASAIARPNGARHLARKRIREGLAVERTRVGVVMGCLRLAAREPGTLARAVSPGDIVRLGKRLVMPDAARVRLVPEPRPTPLQLEVRVVIDQLRHLVDLRDLRLIRFPWFDEPEVSFVIPVWNQWQFTYKCLAAIADKATGFSYEVIVVDNGSSDETRQVLSKIVNLRVIRNETNLGFLVATNRGASVARGKYLLFLNNDTHILSGTVPALLSTIRSDASIGAVGGRLINLDGRLQEAGSVVWNDGSCLGYGRGEDPFGPQYSYVRDVDYCSAALLLTPRELFARVGGFDERYAPAYYEDSDYCLSLYANGFRVVYQPASVIIHHEFGSSRGPEAALKAQAKNRRIFVDKWAARLANQFPPSASVMVARDASRRPRLLFVDDRVPDPTLGTGYPRANRMVTSLRDLGWSVTLFPLLYPERLEPCTGNLQALGIEVITGRGDRRLDLRAFLEQRTGLYDLVLISRPHNMKEALPLVRECAPRARVVYDAEAIFAQRDLQLLHLQGIEVSGSIAESRIREEAGLVRSADSVTAVSAADARTLTSMGAVSVQVVGHHVDVRPTSRSFDERADLLFVGAVLDSPSPNEDAVLYLVREILPLIRDHVQCKLFVVGSNRSSRVAALETPDVRIVGRVDELESWYSHARVFVVPTRFAAGVPMKLHEASAFGLPAVVTPLIAKQVGWADDRECLVGADAEHFARKVAELYSDPARWQRIRSGAIRAVERDCSRENFVAGLRAATTLTARPPRGPRPVSPSLVPSRRHL